MPFKAIATAIRSATRSAAGVGAALALACAAPALHAQAQAPDNAGAAWPTRPVKLVVPFPAGGPVDTLGRAVAEQLGTALGQPVVIDNKAGANGNIGIAEAMRAPRDGYTFTLITTTTSVVNPAVYASLGYDEKDMRPVALYARAPYVLVARPGLNVSTLPELVALLKAQPGKLNASYASTVSQVGLGLTKSTFGVVFTDVPYKGDGEMLNALMAGDIDFCFTSSPQIGAFVASGRMRPIAVAASQRSPRVPGTPTFAEAGSPQFAELSVFYGMGAGAGVPEAVVNRVNREVVKIVASADFKARLDKAGLVPVSPSPDEARSMVANDRARWMEPIRQSGAKAE
ncbi:MAG: tripartite tricarboxylate transporter substrate binding protein [Pseudomonadota bacterium]